MLLKCHNSKCKRIWFYKGKKKGGFYTSCPDCKNSTKIIEHIEPKARG